MKITMHELLELVKDGIPPKKIKFRGCIYYWSFDTYTKRINTPDDQYSLFQEYRIDYCLNDTVEILLEENDEWEDIETSNFDSDYPLSEISRTVIQLIKNQKYLKERLDKNE